ncbi:MAG: hypothetical protein DYG94_02730 [Leptolyngbya sp. PLA3]|nr:MAG: hypothetical protein EDM82_11565 [Cyanobacteria bacterium CYA]MCE7967643.1 hypothetical protein [Leptolyngbya sp. PL-A3]
MPGELIAHEYQHKPGFFLEPARLGRDWTDKFPFCAPSRCLPLATANQGARLIRTRALFTIMWKSRPRPGGLTIDYPEPFADPCMQKSPERCIGSRFGGGIFTINAPRLFRTDKGIGTWMHGPDGARDRGAS